MLLYITYDTHGLVVYIYGEICPQYSKWFAKDEKIKKVNPNHQHY